jgi:hypothetical protein
MLYSEDRIRFLTKAIEELPGGYISNKTINGKVRKYLQWTENGKKKSKYLDDASAIKTEALINERRKYQQELKELLSSLPGAKGDRVAEMQMYGNARASEGNRYKTTVLYGMALKRFAETVKGLKRRESYALLEDYLKNDRSEKVFILYGLRRTGKTTLIRQAILSMSEEILSETAFIQVNIGDSLGELNSDLRLLSENGFKNVFIDEVTLAEDFIQGAALLSDIYAALGMKIVLSGTDSLGFVFSGSEELYDRCIMLHTTFIPYREFERVLDIVGIDEYIRYGGTMSLGGKHYNEAVTFKTKSDADEYVDSAIAKNIQHSLRFYRNGGHFRHLADLYEKNELTSVINRVVEDINHRFTIEVLTKDFISNDLGISRKNLRKDRNEPTDILDRIDIKAFTEGLKNALEILNKDEQSIRIEEVHRAEIKEYLDLLDLTVDIPTEFLPVSGDRLYRTIVAQPGLRYAQAQALVSRLLLDREFRNISAEDRNRILQRIMNEIRGRMMEDIILLETMKTSPGKNVFRLCFAVGEFDMVVEDPANVCCELYEIKHSDTAVPGQCRNLLDDKKCAEAEFRYGRIARKAVIYRGIDKTENGIEYINVENYLKKLGERHDL